MSGRMDGAKVGYAPHPAVADYMNARRVFNDPTLGWRVKSRFYKPNGDRECARRQRHPIQWENGCRSAAMMGCWVDPDASERWLLKELAFGQ